MNAKAGILIVLLILFSTQALASDYVLNIKGKTVDSYGNLEPIYGINAKINEQYVEPKTGTNLEEDGSFWFKDIEFNKSDKLWVVLTGKCIYRFLEITHNGTEFEVMDLQTNEIIQKTASAEIDLGNLSETTPNMFFINSDVPVNYTLFTGDKAQSLGGIINYVTSGATSDIFAENTDYFVILRSENGEEWSASFTAGDYCVGTLLTKRGENLSFSSCPGNECPETQMFPIELIIGGGIVILIIIVLGVVLLKRRK